MVTQVAQSTDGLNRLTEELHGLVGQFRTGGAAQKAAAPATLGDGHATRGLPASPGCSSSV